MDTANRPPNEVFCTQCGPGTVLQPDRQTHLLRCPRCRSQQRLPTQPLFVVGPIHFCNLDCPDAVLADRLRARPSWRGWAKERIVEHQRFAARLRVGIRPTFDATLLSADAVADRVAEWVHGLLASAAPGDTAIAAPPGDWPQPCSA